MPDNSGLVLTRVQANSQNLWQLDLGSKDLTQLTFSAGNVAQYDSEEQLLYHRDGKLFQYVDGARQDIEIKVNEQSPYNALWLHQTDYQYRFSMLGHVEQFNVLTGETRQTQLPHQLIGIHPDPHNPDILYATVFVTPELALEFMEWQPKTEVPN